MLPLGCGPIGTLTLVPANSSLAVLSAGTGATMRGFAGSLLDRIVPVASNRSGSDCRPGSWSPVVGLFMMKYCDRAVFGKTTLHDFSSTVARFVVGAGGGG